MSGGNPTTQHLFWECPEVEKVWKALVKWLSHGHSQISISYENMALCNFEGNNASLINTIILVTKQYIYATRCVMEYQGIEHRIATKNRKIKKHVAKWNLFLGKYAH